MVISNLFSRHIKLPLHHVLCHNLTVPSWFSCISIHSNQPQPRNNRPNASLSSHYYPPLAIPALPNQTSNPATLDDRGLPVCFGCIEGSACTGNVKINKLSMKDNEQVRMTQNMWLDHFGDDGYVIIPHYLFLLTCVLWILEPWKATATSSTKAYAAEIGVW